MFGGMVPCERKSQSGRYGEDPLLGAPTGFFPVVAEDLAGLCAAVTAINADVHGARDLCIAEMGGRGSGLRGGAKALFLELIPGIHMEMNIAEVSPSNMADKLLKAAPRFHSSLVGELDNCVSDDNILLFTQAQSSLRERLRKRIKDSKAPKTARLEALGRMVACFVLRGERVKDFGH